MTRHAFGNPAVHVTVRGMEFPSMNACARHFGVGVGHVTDMVDSGTLDNIGLGRNRHSKQAVALDGQHFESIAALARHIGRAYENLAKKKRMATARGLSHYDIAQGRVSWGGHTPPSSDPAPEARRAD